MTFDDASGRDHECRRGAHVRTTVVLCESPLVLFPRTPPATVDPVILCSLAAQALLSQLLRPAAICPCGTPFAIPGLTTLPLTAPVCGLVSARAS